MDKRTSRKVTRWGLIGGNCLLLILVAVFVLTNRGASQTVLSSTLNSPTGTASSLPSPLDQLSSSQIALTAAQMTNVPELTAIRNQADSDSLLLAVVPDDSTTLAKPQIVSTAEKSKADIVQYITKPGDTVSSLAAQFNVTTNSILWSNNIVGNALSPGVHLVIPPVNGVVYTVKAGDTPASLAARYDADASQIINYNDAEINGLQPGEQIIIPNGSVAAPVLTYGSFVAAYGGNGYDFGFCTYYVASVLPVPRNWGNANTWAVYAQLSGWNVSTVPNPNVLPEIGQTDAGYGGHVAVIEAISPDGSMIKYSDMNGLAGWDRVGYSGWVPASHFEHYIYQ